MGSACSPLSTLGVLGGGPTVDAELTVGDKEEAVNVGDNSTTTETTEQTADKIENIVNGLKWYEFGLLCLLAGWAIPGPWEMFKGIVNFIRLLFGRKPL